MGWLVEPFAVPYVQRALVEAALLAVAGGALGAFVVLRRLAFATHALGVGTFPGVVVAFSLGTGAFAGGLVASLVLALALVLLARRRDLDLPAGTGLVLAGALSLGGLLVSRTFQAGEEVDRLLFGSLLGSSTSDIVRAALVCALALTALAACGRGWVAVAFDREGARALGLRPARLDVALFATLAITVVAAVDAVGSLLASSLLLLPAATAHTVTRRLPALVATSVAIGLAVAAGGLLLSYHVNAPPGATIALLAAGTFGLVQLVRSSRRLRPLRLALAGLAGVALAATGLPACGGSSAPSAGPASPPEASPAALLVVATTPHVADWARVVGGASVEVVQLLEPNVDAHDHEPTPDDADAIASAALVLASGAGLDEWIADLVAGSGGDAPLVEVAPVGSLRPPALAAAEEGEGVPDEEGHGSSSRVDPHYWHDPTLAAAAVATVTQALAAADPASAPAFEERARAYRTELERLDAELSARFAAIPSERRKLVTDHDAFGYLAAHYGIEVVGAAIPSTSTAAEASAAEIAELIETIRAAGAAAIFSESSVDPKLIEQIAAEAGADVVPELYGDSLGDVGSGADTYVGMMRHNADVLARGFAGG